MQISSQHLSGHELEDILIGDASPSAAAHLAACGPCKAALAELEAPLASFRAVTLAWSERHSATLPLHDLQAAQRRAASAWRQRLALSAGLAAALAVGVAIPVLHHETPSNAAQNQLTVSARSASANTETASAAPHESPEQQISRDNQMLRAIDQELDSRADSPASLGLLTVKSEGRGYAAKLQD